MPKILLDYVFPVSVIVPTPAASTAFLKQVCVVAKPASGQEGNVGELYACTSMAQVGVRTDNEDAEELFNAGMSKVFILLSDDLDLSDAMSEHQQEFFTVLISSDFDDDDIGGSKAAGTITISSYANLISGTDDSINVAGVIFTAQTGAATLGDATFRAATGNTETGASLAAQITAHALAKTLVHAVASMGVVTITTIERGLSGNSLALEYTDNDSNIGASVSGALLTGGTAPADYGSFPGVVGISSTDGDLLDDVAATTNRVAFDEDSGGNGPLNMFYSFGKLLSNASQWRNGQYQTMPHNDGVDSLGDAIAKFDARRSFVLNDDQYGNRLALFAAGGQAIVAPYITKNLSVDLQGRALQWIADNQPAYTRVNASLLEARLQQDVINLYISRGWIEAGTVQVSILNDNFVATGAINIAEPKALWRVESEMQQTL